ncbi:MAG: hypothetical protein G01um101413_429 [Parcubacteria group bacterium Gr01-1014_13]|nr:MAG: hypothetical protein G01um101413_429 [Parcubacteria group bacterium Gr01-1014_13]
MNNTVVPEDPSSDDYKRVLAQMLNRLDTTKPVGTALCDAIMRLWPTPAFEAMVFRRSDRGGNEVFLRQRAMNDTAYPGQWHAPGKLYRHGEQDRDVANRLEEEFGTRIEKFDLVDKEITSEDRGTVHSHIFIVKLAGDPRIDDRHKWFPVSDLPSNTVNIHREIIIPKAARVYWQYPRY